MTNPKSDSEDKHSPDSGCFQRKERKSLVQKSCFVTLTSDIFELSHWNLAFYLVIPVNPLISFYIHGTPSVFLVLCRAPEIR